MRLVTHLVSSILLTLLLSIAPAYAQDEPTQIDFQGCVIYGKVAASGVLETQGLAPKGVTKTAIDEAEMPLVIDKLLRQALHDGEIAGAKQSPDEVFKNHMNACVQAKGEIKKLLHPEI